MLKKYWMLKTLHGFGPSFVLETDASLNEAQLVEKYELSDDQSLVPLEMTIRQFDALEPVE